MVSWCPGQRSLFAVGRCPRSTPTPRWERVDLGDGSWIDVVPRYLRGADTVLDDLVDAVPWQCGRRPMYDRMVDDPRLSYRYTGDPSRSRIPCWRDVRADARRALPRAARRARAQLLPRRSRQRGVPPRPRAPRARRHHRGDPHPRRATPVPGPTVRRDAAPGRATSRRVRRPAGDGRRLPARVGARRPQGRAGRPARLGDVALGAPRRRRTVSPRSPVVVVAWCVATSSWSSVAGRRRSSVGRGCVGGRWHHRRAGRSAPAPSGVASTGARRRGRWARSVVGAAVVVVGAVVVVVRDVLCVAGAASTRWRCAPCTFDLRGSADVVARAEHRVGHAPQPEHQQRRRPPRPRPSLRRPRPIGAPTVAPRRPPASSSRCRRPDRRPPRAPAPSSMRRRGPRSAPRTRRRRRASSAGTVGPVRRRRRTARSRGRRASVVAGSRGAPRFGALSRRRRARRRARRARIRRGARGALRSSPPPGALRTDRSRTRRRPCPVSTSVRASTYSSHGWRSCVHLERHAEEEAVGRHLRAVREQRLAPDVEVVARRRCAWW